MGGSQSVVWVYWLRICLGALFSSNYASIFSSGGARLLKGGLGAELRLGIIRGGRKKEKRGSLRRGPLPLAPSVEARPRSRRYLAYLQRGLAKAVVRIGMHQLLIQEAPHLGHVSPGGGPAQPVPGADLGVPRLHAWAGTCNKKGGGPR